MLKLYVHWIFSVGSEHTINGRRFPLELHVVMYNSKFANLSSAANQPKGLCVIGFVYEVTLSVLPFAKIFISVYSQIDRTFRHLRNPFIKYVQQVQTYKEKSAGQPALRHINELFTLRDLVKSTKWNYITYEGSLTTPECMWF